MPETYSVPPRALADAVDLRDLVRKNQLDTALAGKVDTSLVGAASGVAPLNAGSLVPIANLPVGTTSSTVAPGDRPRGMLARAARTTNATATVAAAERQVLGLPAVSVAAGRLYRVTAPSLTVYGSAAAGYSVVLIRFTTDGSAPTITSTQLAQSVIAMPVASIGYTNTIQGFYAPSASGTFRPTLSYQGSASNNATMVGSATYPISLLVEDVGLDPGTSGTNY